MKTGKDLQPGDIVYRSCIETDADISPDNAADWIWPEVIIKDSHERLWRVQLVGESVGDVYIGGTHVKGDALIPTRVDPDKDYPTTKQEEAARIADFERDWAVKGAAVSAVFRAYAES